MSRMDGMASHGIASHSMAWYEHEMGDIFFYFEVGRESVQFIQFIHSFIQLFFGIPPGPNEEPPMIGWLSMASQCLMGMDGDGWGLHFCDRDSGRDVD